VTRHAKHCTISVVEDTSVSANVYTSLTAHLAQQNLTFVSLSNSTYFGTSTEQNML